MRAQPKCRTEMIIHNMRLYLNLIDNYQRMIQKCTQNISNYVDELEGLNEDARKGHEKFQSNE